MRRISVRAIVEHIGEPGNAGEAVRYRFTADPKALEGRVCALPPVTMFRTSAILFVAKPNAIDTILVVHDKNGVKFIEADLRHPVVEPVHASVTLFQHDECDEPDA